MPIGIDVDGFVSYIGPSDMLTAFFSTVGNRLEPGGWGSRFPALQNELFKGKLAPGRGAAARAELDQVRAEFAQMPVAELVWDWEDRAKRPPWGDRVPAGVTNLAGYFRTEDDVNLLETIDRALGRAEQFGAPAEIVTGVKASDHVSLSAGFVVWRIGSLRTTRWLFDALSGAAPAGDATERFPRLLHDLRTGEIAAHDIAAARQEWATVLGSGALDDFRTDFDEPVTGLLDAALEHAANAERPLKLQRMMSQKPPFADELG